MAEGTKSLYLSAALYFTTNFVTVTNQKLVADPRMAWTLFDGERYLYPSRPRKPGVGLSEQTGEQVITYTEASWQATVRVKSPLTLSTIMMITIF